METLLLAPSEESLDKAARLLLEGQVVGIPTETVYGLAADAFNPQAVEKIFRAKGRPQDNPLIVHISDIRQLELVAERVPKAALKLAAAFWPGPLTMIMKKSQNLPDIVSAGLDTVGIRMPLHKTAREIISKSRPLAAPSANTSGKPSPTEAMHVFEDMHGKIPLIIDGGACSVGVESTVVDMTGEIPRVLRPGAVTEEMIAEVLGAAETDEATKKGLAKGQTARSPGMKYRHYAPKAPVVLYEGAPEDTFKAISENALPQEGVICFDEYIGYFDDMQALSLGPSWDHHSHDRHVFSHLRHFDSTDVAKIHVQCPREFGGGEGSANRLRRAAGFNCVICSSKTVAGITGPSGGGKSAFCRNILSLFPGNILYIDADEVYHRLLSDPLGCLSQKILESFPEARQDGRLQRGLLAQVVFRSKVRLELLNKIAHKAVLEEIRRLMEESSRPVVLLDVPLLFESGLDRICTITAGIISEKEQRLKRVLSRDNISESDALMRFENQPDAAFYEQRCDIIVKNDGDEDGLLGKSKAFAEKYLTVK